VLTFAFCYIRFSILVGTWTDSSSCLIQWNGRDANTPTGLLEVRYGRDARDLTYPQFCQLLPYLFVTHSFWHNDCLVQGWLWFDTWRIAVITRARKHICQPEFATEAAGLTVTV